jgi:hypothetical protein
LSLFTTLSLMTTLLFIKRQLLAQHSIAFFV